MFPDNQRFGVLWMGRRALGRGLRHGGRLQRRRAHACARRRRRRRDRALDQLLAPYGGLGAYGREDQLSHRFLDDEIAAARHAGDAVPGDLPRRRRLPAERGARRGWSRCSATQIAALKASATATATVAWHYLKLVLAIVLARRRSAASALGAWLGACADRHLHRVLSAFPTSPSGSSRRSCSAASCQPRGGRRWRRRSPSARAVRLPPAEAMRPPSRRRATARAGSSGSACKRWLSQPHAHDPAQPRAPARSQSALTVLGIALRRRGIILVGLFQRDAIDYMVDVQFGMAQREDLTVDLHRARPRARAHELRACRACSRRGVPRRAGAAAPGHRSYATALRGFEPRRPTCTACSTPTLRPWRCPPTAWC